jgi:predicted GNAT family acetyltransferase
MPTPVAITHNPAASRFEAEFDGRLAVCAYHLVNGVMHLTHTEVPPSLQGQGIAAQLVRETLAWARNEGLRVRPLCSYVAAYMRRYPETQDLIS